MTLEERKAAANIEWQEIWLNTERKRIYMELNTKPGTKGYFEDNKAAYEEMYKELACRCLEVQKKYDLPRDTKIKLW